MGCRVVAGSFEMRRIAEIKGRPFTLFRTDTELVGGLTRANLLLDSRVAQ